MTATEYVILVDDEDNQIGVAEKIKAHEENWLHRAFSIFIFRKENELETLLQQRALHKYHSPGLWTNTCCSHPRPEETILEAGERRLQEELGLQVKLKNVGWFQYNVRFVNGLSENEIDHVLIGYLNSSQTPRLNPEEVHASRWITISDLKHELAHEPQKFTPWINQALQLALS